MSPASIFKKLENDNPTGQRQRGLTHSFFKPAFCGDDVSYSFAAQHGDQE